MNRLERRRRRRLNALLRWDRALRIDGVRLLAGVDEVGVGPLAGPVVAAAVVLPDEPVVIDVDDSKVVPRKRREELASKIRRVALDVSVGVVEVDEIETLNVYRAGIEAMRRAVLGLRAAVDRVVVDARTIPDLAVAQTAVVHADRLSYAVAAASIVAKVHRDAMMTELAGRYPGYGFDRHAGYATVDHREAIRRLGPCPAHRRTFQLV